MAEAISVAIDLINPAEMAGVAGWMNQIKIQKAKFLSDLEAVKLNNP